MGLEITIQRVQTGQTSLYRSNYIKALRRKLQKLGPYISLSDSGEWLIGTAAAKTHGVDIELLRPRANAFDKWVLTRSEFITLNSLIAAKHAATLGWSIKEACYKCALGGYEPSDYTISRYDGQFVYVKGLRQNYKVLISRTLPGYVICLALTESAIIGADEARYFTANAWRAI